MSLLQDPEYLLNEQYRTASNLNSRINLHLRCSTNSYGWFRWVFDQFHFKHDSWILELGCGPGNLWLENHQRIPRGCRVVLSDFSHGMVVKSKQKHAEFSLPFDYNVIDASAIPFQSHLFDAVIANHCVYHFPDLTRALSEINRVLKHGGDFYCTTVGESHLREIGELILKFNFSIDDAFKRDEISFTLENGTVRLEPWFDEIMIHRYPDSLRVNDPLPLVEFILSTSRFGLDIDQRQEFIKFIQGEIESNGGEIIIQKDSGIFISS